MLRYRFSIMILCCLALLPFRIGRGQDVGFTLSVDRTNITMNQQVQLEIDLQNADRYPEVNLDLDAFSIVGGPARSSSYQWVNGQAFSSRKIIYTLAPLRPGAHTIGPLLMQYRGKKYTSNSVTITVSSAPAARGQQSPSGQQPEQTSPEDQVSDVVYIQAMADKTTAYPGEQITVTYKLYTRVSVRNYSIDDQANATGFWKEKIETPENPQLRQEVVNGIRYNTAIIKRMAYFPTKSGELTIEPLPVTVKVQASRSRSFFDDFFSDPFSRVVTKQLAGNAITVEVRPIPAEGRPLSFNGAVGDFRLTSSLDTTVTHVDEAVGMNILIEGTGNLPMVNIQLFDPPDGLDMFEPEIEKDIEFRNRRLTGEVQYQYVFIPRRDGTIRLPS
ncbi:MAG TPA: BatD family protein, partial [bacterium]|nr:BatD family protein [bacterium]